MTKNCIGLCLVVIICIIGMFWMTSVACAEDTGVLTMDLTPDLTAPTIDATSEFQPMHIKVVKRTDETEVTMWESDIIKQEDIDISLPTGAYKLYVQFQGHRTIWELDNEGKGYEITPSSSTVVPTWVNDPYKDVFADAPWRVQSSQIPILVMVKDAKDGDGIGGDYDLGNVEIYLDEDCDKDNNEDDDIFGDIETCWNGLTINESIYNLYYLGDWYGITYLDLSDVDLSGDICLHVVIRDVGGFLDPDYDAHSHFNVTIATETLPTLPNWHGGDTHYHSSYTDNDVEFGFPIEATVEAGKSIGLYWNAITDHSFDLRDSRTADPNHKWNTLKSDVSSYTTDSYKLILGEEVSCYGHQITYAIVPPGRGVVHFLVLGMENFRDVIGTGIDFIPGQFDEDLVDIGGQTLNLEDVINIVNTQGGVGYAAHPEGHRDAGAVALGRVPWVTEDYDLTGYNGLQVWNGECTQNTDWMTERDDGLEQWKRLLLNGRKDVFIAGGTDAHGDFSHTTHYTIPPVVEETDNAFGKVRTYVYTETFSKDGILEALRNGHSIMTDGPLVIFNITNEYGETAIIGDEIAGNELTLNIQWESTSEFGNVGHIYVHRGIIGENEEEIYHLTPNSLSGTHTYSDLASKIPESKTAYIRIHATNPWYIDEWGNFQEGNRVYTNPIWVISIGRSGGPDSFGYTFKDSNIPDGPIYDWIEISDTGTPILQSSDDSWVENINIGFFFNYYGTDYSQLAISNNGLLFSGVGTWQYVNQPITQTPGVHGFVAPLWDDIVTWGSADAIYYQTMGTAPNRMFVVEWHDNQHYYSSTSGVTFQAILYEGSNNIKFQYKDVSFGTVTGSTSSDLPPYDNGGSATVGIEGPAGDDGLQYSFNEQVIDSGLAILFKFPQFAGTNLYLSKQAPASKDQGSTMTYTLHYHNFGDTAAQNVVLEDTLPAEVEFVSASDAGSYDSNTRKVTWDIGSVAPNGHGYETVTVRIPESIAVGTVIENDASISTSTLEVRYDDNEAKAQTRVTGSNLPPDVSVEPNLGQYGGLISLWYGDPITFSYHSCPTATGVDIRIQINDGGQDITGSMTGGPPDWTYTTTFYPRWGRATVTYTVYGCDTDTVIFDIYIDPAGFIYDIDTGERIGGATVWLQRPDGTGDWENVPTGETPPIAQPDVNPLITNNDGQYQWDVLAGSYRVYVEALGYYPANSIVVSIPPPVTDLHVGLTRIPSANHPPTAADDTVSIDEDTPVTIDVAANDVDVDGNLDPTTATVISDPSDGIVVNNGDGTFTDTPNENFFGTDSFAYEICDTEGVCDNAMVFINVNPINDPPEVSVDIPEQTVQYSDGITAITISATDIDSELLTLSTTWTKDEGDVELGLPNGLNLEVEGCDPESTPVTCTWTLEGQALVDAGTYEIMFTVSDGVDENEASVTLVVEPEDAVCVLNDDNPVAVQVAVPDGNSGVFSLIVDVTEALPDSSDGLPYPGDISLAEVSMSLLPVGPGSPKEPTSCSRTESGTGYEKTVMLTCDFENVGVNTYEVLVTVSGGYYVGSCEDVLVVYDPSLGFTTGGGTFFWPETDEKTNFGFTMKYNKKGTNIQGNLLLVRHLHDGTIYRVKSNALYGLALGEFEENGEIYGWASFSGKATYLELGWQEPKGNHEFIAYVEDRNEPGKGIDRFWITVKDQDRVAIDTMSMADPAEDNAVELSGGNMVVPHKASGN
jgi:uncharacterized repeat protein (TIGR01451 family)